MLSIVLIFVSSITASQAERLPRFEDFPVKNDYVARPAPAKINSPRARLFRTAIRTGAKDGPNFAGHYTVVRWGCGAGCHQFAIVDAKTGAVYFPHALTQIDSGPWVGDDPLASEETMQFAKDSRLFVGVGRRYVGEDDRGMGKYYYVWRNNRLKLIASIRRNY